MTTINTLLPTSLVGSYAQPNWLLDRAKLAGRFPPRTRSAAKQRSRPHPRSCFGAGTCAPRRARP